MGKGTKCSDLNLNDSGSWFFWGLIALLFLLVIANFVLTLIIISYFKIGFGMESIKLIPEMKMIKFYGSTNFDRIYKKDGQIETFRDSPAVIECKKGNICVNISKTFLFFQLMKTLSNSIYWTEKVTAQTVL